MKLLQITILLFFSGILLAQLAPNEFYYIDEVPNIQNSLDGGKLVTASLSSVQIIHEDDIEVILGAPGPTHKTCPNMKIWLGGTHHVICGPAISFIQDVSGRVIIECGDFNQELCIVAASN